MLLIHLDLKHEEVYETSKGTLNMTELKVDKFNYAIWFLPNVNILLYFKDTTTAS